MLQPPFVFALINLLRKSCSPNGLLKILLVNLLSFLPTSIKDKYQQVYYIYFGGIMNYPYKIVKFDEYCPTCEHCNVDETEEPCNTCLETEAREGTRVPEKYEANEKRAKQV